MPRVLNRLSTASDAPMGLISKSASDPLSGSSSSTSAHTPLRSPSAAATDHSARDAFTFDSDEPTLTYTTTGRKPLARSLHLSLMSCRKSGATLATPSAAAVSATAAAISARLQTPKPLAHEIVCATPTRVACLSPGSVSSPSSAPDSGSSCSQAAAEDAPLFFVAPPPTSQPKGPRAIASMLQSLPESPRSMPSLADASVPAAAGVSSLTESVSTAELTDSENVVMEPVATPRVTRSGRTSAPSTSLRSGTVRTPRATPIKSAAPLAAVAIAPKLPSNPCTPIRGSVSASAAAPSVPSFSLSALSSPSTPVVSATSVPMSSLSSLPSPYRLPTPSPSPSCESATSSESPEPSLSEQEPSPPPPVSTQHRVRGRSPAASAVTASPWKSASEKVKCRKRAATLQQQPQTTSVKLAWFAPDVAALAVEQLSAQRGSTSKRKSAAAVHSVAAAEEEEAIVEDDAEPSPIFTTAPRSKRSRTQQKRQEDLRRELGALTGVEELRAFAQRLIEQMQ